MSEQYERQLERDNRELPILLQLERLRNIARLFIGAVIGLPIGAIMRFIIG